LDCDDHLRIDLHLHSTASDGTLTPSEILTVALELNLGAIAITDHDTIDGSKEAQCAGIPPSVKFLSGVEISASPPPSVDCSGSLHILGYGINLDDPDLNATLRVLQRARKNRNPRIIERLNDLGFDFSVDDVVKEVGEGQLGRPHIARYMVKRRFVNSIDEAFDQYLAQGRPAYENKYRIGCQQAIGVISGAGGIPVIAHPYLLNIQNKNELEDLIEVLKEMGLLGIEVFYPEHPREETAFYAEIAKQHGLFITGGTDFHGAVTPEIQMGIGKGNFYVPYALYEQIITKRKVYPTANRC
jgi:predicted metal-dependent phosphoesterase TrpH